MENAFPTALTISLIFSGIIQRRVSGGLGEQHPDDSRFARLSSFVCFALAAAVFILSLFF